MDSYLPFNPYITFSIIYLACKIFKIKSLMYSYGHCSEF